MSEHVIQKHFNLTRNFHEQVFDEADMLLCGSFQNQVIRLIHMLRFDEKLISRMTNSTKEPVTDGTSALDKELDHELDEELDHELDEDLDHELDEESKHELDEESDPGVSEADASYEDQTENEELLESKAKGESSNVRRAKNGWRRVREIYKRSKQYVFVAATLPKSGKKTAGGVLKRMFPDATWVNGAHLHRHNPRYATTSDPLFSIRCPTS
jgi:hypothetical protein